MLLVKSYPCLQLAKQINQDVSKIWDIFYAVIGAKKKNWMYSDFLEDCVCKQDNKFEGQNPKVLFIVDNWIPEEIIPEELTLKEFANFDNTAAAAESIFSDESSLQWCVNWRNQPK